MASQLSFDSRSRLDDWENEDTTMLAMSQEIDEHTVHLRKAVLASVASIRTRIHQQTADLLEKEREEARETQRRLLQQVESLTRLVETRNEELEQAHNLNDRLVTMISKQKRRQRERTLATEALQKWNEHVKSKKYREKMVQHLTDVRKERQARILFNAWRVESEKLKAKEHHEKLEGEHKRATARLENEFRTTENRMKLEVLALKEQLANEEERQNLLAEKHKAAFMRGVCAMNLEAMQAIRTGQQEDDVSVASFLQNMNISGLVGQVGSPASTNAQPASTERLMEQQLQLNAQLQQFENAAAPEFQQQAAPQQFHQAPAPRPESAPQPQQQPAQPAIPRNEPRVTVTVNPKYATSASGGTLSAGAVNTKTRSAMRQPPQSAGAKPSRPMKF